MIDVTFRHEDAGYLDEGHRSKLQKYTPLHHLADQLKVNTGRVLPLVIGTRGCIPSSTTKALRELNVTDRGSLVTISLLALRALIEIYHLRRNC
jgi:hypothetical protein